MKKYIINKLGYFIAFCFIVFLPVFKPLEAKAAVVQAVLPEFDITINGIKINNNLYSRYPFIVYRDITYFPVTYAQSRFLGLETKWNENTGLEIYKTGISYPFMQYDSKTKNSCKYSVSIPDFHIKINGRAVENQKEEYPLLYFRDITYFPMTWKYAAEEFGWEYSFEKDKGLVIKSGNIVPEELKLYDYKTPDDWYDSGGEFILYKSSMYYAGNKGAVYKDGKKIYEVPLNDEGYSPAGTYVHPYFEERSGRLYMDYHIGGAVMGTTYEAEIHEDGTVSEAVALPGTGAGGPGMQVINGYKMDWPSSEDKDVAAENIRRATRYQGEQFDYVIAYKEGAENEGGKIYKLDKYMNTLTPISDIPVEEFKYREGSIYFTGEGNLYSFAVGEENEMKAVMPLSDNALYEVLGGHIYYWSGGKIYEHGKPEAINSGEEIFTIELMDDYLMLRFFETVPGSYRTIFYDKEGNQVFKSSSNMNVIHKYSDTIIYYDDVTNKILKAKLK